MKKQIVFLLFLTFFFVHYSSSAPNCQQQDYPSRFLFIISTVVILESIEEFMCFHNFLQLRLINHAILTIINPIHLRPYQGKMTRLPMTRNLMRLQIRMGPKLAIQSFHITLHRLNEMYYLSTNPNFRGLVEFGHLHLRGRGVIQNIISGIRLYEKAYSLVPTEEINTIKREVETNYNNYQKIIEQQHLEGGNINLSLLLNFLYHYQIENVFNNNIIAQIQVLYLHFFNTYFTYQELENSINERWQIPPYNKAQQIYTLQHRNREQDIYWHIKTIKWETQNYNRLTILISNALHQNDLVNLREQLKILSAQMELIRIGQLIFTYLRNQK